VDGVGGQDDNLRFTVDTSNAIHRAYKTGLKSVGKRYRASFDYYIPSGQSNVDNIRVTETNGTDILADNLNVTDAWTRATFESVATTNGFYFYAKDGIATTFQDASGDDVFYIRNVTVTEIGTLADFRAENYDPDSSTLADISDNAFIGTNNGATFVGNGLPPHAATRQQLAETNALKTTAPSMYFNGSSSVVTVADDDKLTFSSLTEFGTTTETTLWSPEDNTPALTDGTGTLNQHYKIDADGTVVQGGSTLSIINGASVTAGQVVYYDGSVWRVKDCDDLPFSVSSWVKRPSGGTFYVSKYFTTSQYEWRFQVNSSGTIQYLPLDFVLTTGRPL